MLPAVRSASELSTTSVALAVSLCTCLASSICSAVLLVTACHAARLVICLMRPLLCTSAPFAALLAACCALLLIGTCHVLLLPTHVAFCLASHCPALTLTVSCLIAGLRICCALLWHFWHALICACMHTGRGFTRGCPAMVLVLQRPAFWHVGCAATGIGLPVSISVQLCVASCLMLSLLGCSLWQGRMALSNRGV